MKRSRVIRLVLLGGGMAAMLAACGDQRRREDCERARAELRPDAEEICRRSSSYRSGGGGYYGFTAGRSRSDLGSSTVTGTSRGGFGSTASSAGS